MTAFSKWKTIGYAAAIFVAGGISGGALGVYETRSHLFAPPGDQEIVLRIRNRLRTKLKLTPDQVAKLDPVVNSAARNLRSIRMETAQRVNKVFEETYAQVSAVLTPEQRVKLDEMQKERHEMLQHFQGHWHPGFGMQGDHPHDAPPRDEAPADGSGTSSQ